VRQVVQAEAKLGERPANPANRDERFARIVAAQQEDELGDLAGNHVTQLLILLLLGPVTAKLLRP
jgi:hypothetical protein